MSFVRFLAPLAAVLALLGVGAAGCMSPQQLSPKLDVRAASAWPVRAEQPFDFAPFVDSSPRQPNPGGRLERITTAVPWPRGLAPFGPDPEKIVILARGRHRRSGGVDPAIEDQAGALFVVDASVAEPVVPGVPAGARVRSNADVLADPSQGPFLLYDPQSGEPAADTRMDRPYCTLRYDAASQNYFICGYSGVDLPGAKFRKNATDSIHRFDMRTGRWHAVEMHDASVVPENELSYTVSNEYYPHHDPATNPAPHGWLNGGDNAAVAGDYLYVVAKDNHLLVQYDLAEIRSNPEAGAPESRPVLGSAVELVLPADKAGDEAGKREVPLYGHSALAVHEGWIYIGFRTSSVVVRFPLAANGDILTAEGGELIAAFEPWRPADGRSANLMDIAFDSNGVLYVSCATKGRVWRIGVPDPKNVFNGFWDSPNRPWIDLPSASGKAKARVGNILFDAEDRMYICSGNYDAGDTGGAGGQRAGVIYRASPE